MHKFVHQENSDVIPWKFQLKSVKTIETAEEKLGWIFTAFDEDGGGFMDSDEVVQIVLGLFRFIQQHHNFCHRCFVVLFNSTVMIIVIICLRMAGIPEDDEMLPSCVEDVRASIDLDGDGDITKEEFVRNALKNDFMSKLLKYENNLPWIIKKG